LVNLNCFYEFRCCECMLATRRHVLSLVLRVIFPELVTSGQLYYLDVMILFDLYIIFLTIIKARITHQ
jgi:hypothetical protein